MELGSWVRLVIIPTYLPTSPGSTLATYLIIPPANTSAIALPIGPAYPTCEKCVTSASHY